MNKQGIIRLLNETSYRPLNINHNAVMDVHTLLEYKLREGSKTLTLKIFHLRGDRQECLNKIKLLQQEDKNIFHVNY